MKKVIVEPDRSSEPGSEEELDRLLENTLAGRLEAFRKAWKELCEEVKKSFKL